MTIRISTLIFSLLLVGTVAACTGNGDTLDVESIRDGVFTITGDARTQISAPERAALSVGDSIDVDAAGRALVRFPDLLTVEVLRNGELVLQDLSVDEQSAFVTVAQHGGVLVNDFSASQEIERRFTVETEFATITATGTQFVVAYEQSGDQIWVLAQQAAGNDLQVEAAGATQAVTSGMASSVREGEPPTEPIPYDAARLESWLTGLRDTGEAAFDVAGVVLGAPTVLLERSDSATSDQIDTTYEFSAPAGSIITAEIEVTDVSGQPDETYNQPQFYLQDANGSLLEGRSVAEGEQYVIRHMLALDSDTTLILLVRQVFGSSSYTIRVTAQQQLDGGRLGDAGDTFETADPITIGSGTTYRGLLGDEDQVDAYRFSADAGTSIAIEASASDESYRGGISIELLHVESGEKVAFLVAGPGNSNRQTTTLDKAEDYLLTVHSYGLSEYAFSIRADE